MGLQGKGADSFDSRCGVKAAGHTCCAAPTRRGSVLPQLELAAEDAHGGNLCKRHRLHGATVQSLSSHSDCFTEDVAEDVSLQPDSHELTAVSPRPVCAFSQARGGNARQPGGCEGWERR